MRTLLVAPLIAATGAQAAPVTLAWQGRLIQASGEPVAGTHDLVVEVRDGTAAPQPRWTGTFDDVAVEGGYVALTLGAAPGNPLDGSVLATPPVTLTVRVDGTALSPAFPVLDVPRAAYASSIPTSAVTAALAAATCTGDGVLGYDATTESLRICHGGSWKVIWTGQGYRYYRISSPTWTNGYMIICNLSMFDASNTDLIGPGNGAVYSMDTVTWGNVNNVANRMNGGGSTTTCVQSDGNNNHWFIVDFGTAKKVTSFGLTGYESSHKPTGTWFLEASNNGTSWTQVWSGAATYWPSVGDQYPVPTVMVVP
jgi:hypothetical protein